MPGVTGIFPVVRVLCKSVVTGICCKYVLIVGIELFQCLGSGFQVRSGTSLHFLRLFAEPLLPSWLWLLVDGSGPHGWLSMSYSDAFTQHLVLFCNRTRCCYMGLEFSPRASISFRGIRVCCSTTEVAFLCCLSSLSSAQVTYLCFEHLPDYSHAISHLVLRGMCLNYQSALMLLMSDISSTVLVLTLLFPVSFQPLVLLIGP